MTTYYLQWVKDTPTSTPRQLIDTKEWASGLTVQTIQAPSWLHAKEALGYPLTALQAYLREREINGPMVPLPKTISPVIPRSINSLSFFLS